jgi:replicative DNA helicase
MEDIKQNFRDQKTTLRERVPPQSEEAESAVLGSLMLDKNAIIKVADILTSDDFYKTANEIVYKAMLDLYEARVPIDLVSLKNRLGEKNELEKIGGVTYLSNLVNVITTASNVEYYAKIVHKKSILRRLIETGSEVTQLGYKEEDDVDVLLDEAEKKVFKVSERSVKESFVSVKSVLEEAFDRLEELHENKDMLRGMPTGFHDLDNLLAGLQKSDLVILAARPSVGKTSLALDIARNVAGRTKKTVGFFSLEMSKNQLVDRVLCAEARVDSWKLRTGKLNDEDFQKIGNAMGVLSDIPLFIEDAPGLNVMQMRTMARRLKADNDLGLIVIDYLQLMEGRGRTDNRVEVVSEISRSLKGLAREIDVPVLALSQLSRAVEMRSPAIPKLSDLRESGSIEQDADVVLFIYRPSMDREAGEEKRQSKEAKIIIAKHRNGPTGEIDLFFDAEKSSFRDLDRSHRGEIPMPSEAIPIEEINF